MYKNQFERLIESAKQAIEHAERNVQISAYASEYVGSEFDPDEALEDGAVEHIMNEDK